MNSLSFRFFCSVRALVVALLLAYPLGALGQDGADGRVYRGEVVSADDVTCPGAVIYRVDPRNGEKQYLATTDAEGRFVFRTEAKEDSLSVHVACLGYKEFKGDVFSAQDNSIFLDEDVEQLAGAVVRSEAKLIEFHDGKTVFNVNAIPKVESYSTMEMFTRLPGVSADNGSVKLYGVAATIYINGVQQKMTVDALNTYLESLPASAVQSIEVDPVPGAEYANDVKSVINVRLKKNFDDGKMFRFASTGAFSNEGLDDVGADAFLLISSGRTTVNSNLSYGNDRLYTNYADSLFFKDNGAYLKNRAYTSGRRNTIMSVTNVTHLLKNGASLDFNAFIFYGLGHPRKETYRSETGVQWNQEILARTDDDLYSATLKYTSPQDRPFKWSAYYVGKFGGQRSGSEIYSVGQGTKDLYMEEKTDMFGHAHTLSADFKYDRGSWFKVNFGAELDYGVLRDDVTEHYAQAGHAGYTSAMKGNEISLDAFTKLTFRFSKQTGLDLGARYRRIGYEVEYNGAPLLSKHYQMLQPSLTFYHHAGVYNLSVGVTSGTQQPNYEDMIPGRRYVNTFTYSEGNADLNPMSYYIFHLSQTFFNSVNLILKYQHISDYWVDVYRYSPQEQVILSTIADLSRVRTLNASLTVPYRFFGGRLYGSLSGYAVYLMLPPETLSLFNKSHFFQSEYSFNAAYDATDRLTFNCSGAYYPAMPTYQGRDGQTGRLNVGVMYSFLKDKNLTLKLNARNILNSANYRSEISFDNVGRIRENYKRYGIVEFSLIYRFKTGEKVESKVNDYVPDLSRFGQ